MEKATNANKLQCLNYCTSEYLPPSQETNASEQGSPSASEPSPRSRPARRENSNAAPNKERGLVLSSKKSKNSSVVPFDESKLPRVPEEKTEDDEEAPSAPEKKEEGEEEKSKDTKPKAEKKSKRQKAWDYTKRKRNELRGKMKDTQREIKELEPDPLKVGPVTVPASVVGFIEKNAKRFELIGLALWDFPFELTFHFFKEIGHIVSFLNLMPAFLNHKTQENKREILNKIIQFTKNELVKITQNEEDQKKHKFSMMHKIKGKMSSLMSNDKNLTALGGTDLKAQLNREKVKFNGLNSKAFEFVDRKKIYKLINVAYAWILADYGIVFCANLPEMFKNVKNGNLNDQAQKQCQDLEKRKESFFKNEDFLMGFEESWKFAGDTIIKKITTSGLITFLFGDNDNTTKKVSNIPNFFNPTISNYAGDYSKSNTPWQMKIDQGKMPFKIKKLTDDQGALKNGCISSFFHLMDNYRQNLDERLENHHVGLMMLSVNFLGPLSANTPEKALTHQGATSIFVEQFQTIQRLFIESFDALVLRDAYDFSQIFENCDNALNYFQQISLKEESDGWGNWLWMKKGKDFELPDDFRLKFSVTLKNPEDEEIIHNIQEYIKGSLVENQKNTEVNFERKNNNSPLVTFDIPIETTNNLVMFHKNFEEKQKDFNRIKEPKFFFSNPLQSLTKTEIEKSLYQVSKLFSIANESSK